MTGIATTMTELQDIQFSLPILSSHQTPTVKDGPKLPAYALERDSNRFPGFTSLSTNYALHSLSSGRAWSAPSLSGTSKSVYFRVDPQTSQRGDKNTGSGVTSANVNNASRAVKCGTLVTILCQQLTAFTSCIDTQLIPNGCMCQKK